MWMAVETESIGTFNVYYVHNIIFVYLRKNGINFTAPLLIFCTRTRKKPSSARYDILK